MLFWCSAPCKNRALDRALWCSPSCKNRALACESCYRQWARHNIYIYIYLFIYLFIYLSIYNYLHVSMYMWMFCNHRSPRPCLHTFFIVFRRVPPHTFHTFLVNMISHPHGIPPPVLYTFVIFCYCHLSVILWNSSENYFSRFCQGYLPPLMHTFSKMYETRPPSVFLVYTGGLCMYVCMYVCMHLCMYVCMHACMHVCMYVCIQVRIPGSVLQVHVQSCRGLNLYALALLPLPPKVYLTIIGGNCNGQLEIAYIYIQIIKNWW